MTLVILLLTCLLLSPWVVQFFRYVTTRPEAIPTPTWMVTTTVLVIFGSSLISGLVFGDVDDTNVRSAGWIAFTAFFYWLVFTFVYSLLAGRRRTVQPFGPRGFPTILETLKMATLSTSLKAGLLSFVPLVLIKLYFIASHGLGLSGGGMAMMKLPYGLLIIFMVTQSGAMAFTTLFAARLFGQSSLAARLICVFALAINLGLAVVAGRRPTLIFFGLTALGLMWTGRRRQVISIVGLAVAVWFVLAVFSPVFLRARTIWRTKDGPDVMAAFRIAIDEQRTEGKAERLSRESEVNITNRLHGYKFWLAFYENYIGKPIGGLLLGQAILMNIPRLFLGLDKYSLGPTEEYIFGTEDISNNVCLESFVDLGPAGPFVYGIIFACVFAVIDVLHGWIARRNKYIAILVAGWLIEPLVSPEADLAGYISIVRNLLMMGVVTIVVSAIMGRFPATGNLNRPGD